MVPKPYHLMEVGGITYQAYFGVGSTAFDMPGIYVNCNTLRTYEKACVARFPAISTSCMFPHRIFTSPSFV